VFNFEIISFIFYFTKALGLGLCPHLFVKLPRPGQRSYLFGLRVKLPPVTTSLTTHW